MKTTLENLKDRARAVSFAKIALIAWVLDVLSCLYFIRWFEASGKLHQTVVNAFRIQGIDLVRHDPNFLLEMEGMIGLIISGLLLALIVTNTIFYWGYSKAKRWSINYVTGFIVTAAFLGFTMLFEGFPVGGLWEVANIVGIFGYPVLGFVAWVKKKDLNLADGSPAR